MVTSLAARRGTLTPPTGKEAGTGLGSRRVGSWSSPSAQHTFGRLGLTDGWRGWGGPGGGEEAFL